MYKLAQRGVSSCVRLFNDFEREQPGTARLVVKAVEMDLAKDVAANKHLDKVLGKAEKVKKTKSGKQKTAKLPKSFLDQAHKLAVHDQFLRSMLNSDDPSEREAARGLLGG